MYSSYDVFVRLNVIDCYGLRFATLFMYIYPDKYESEGAEDGTSEPRKPADRVQPHAHSASRLSRGIDFTSSRKDAARERV